MTEQMRGVLMADGHVGCAFPSSALPDTSLADFLDAIVQRLPQWAAALFPLMKEVEDSLPPWARATGNNDLEASAELIALENDEARNSFAYNFRAGLLCWNEDKVEEALRYLGQAVALDPTSASPHVWIAWCHNKSDAHASALASFRRTIELTAWSWPDDDQVEAAARWATKCGDREFAVLARQELVRRHPDSADAHCWLGVLLKRVRPQDAEAELRRSVELEPKMHAVHSLARLIARRGDFAGARGLLDLLRKDDGALPKSSVPLQKEIDERERLKGTGGADESDDDDGEIA